MKHPEAPAAERLRLPRQVPLGSSICQLESRRPLDPDAQPTPLCGNVARLEAKPLGELDPGEVRLLVGQRSGLPWTACLALALVADDPLLEATFYPGDVLLALLGGLTAEEWRANPEAVETVRRALARVAQLASVPEDPAEGLDEDQAAALARGRAAQFLRQQLKKDPRAARAFASDDEPAARARWRLPDPAPRERSVHELAARPGLEPYRRETEALRRLDQACRAPLGELDPARLRLLLAAHEGLPWVLPPALEVVEHDPLAAADGRPGDLLEALLDLRIPQVWGENPALVAALRGALARVEQAATDPDPARAGPPLALLERLERRGLWPWEPLAQKLSP